MPWSESVDDSVRNRSQIHVNHGSSPAFRPRFPPRFHRFHAAARRRLRGGVPLRQAFTRPGVGGLDVGPRARCRRHDGDILAGRSTQRSQKPIEDPAAGGIEAERVADQELNASAVHDQQRRRGQPPDVLLGIEHQGGGAAIRLDAPGAGRGKTRDAADPLDDRYEFPAVQFLFAKGESVTTRGT